MTTWAETMQGLLGKRVTVILSETPTVMVTGKLLTFDDYGGVAIREDNGTIRHAWPNLHIRELTE